MKCPKCNTAMDVLGSSVSPNGKLLMTSFRCPACGKRLLRTEPNTRYQPIPTITPLPPSKYRRMVDQDPGYPERPCCKRCGEQMEHATGDGLCNLCAGVAA